MSFSFASHAQPCRKPCLLFPQCISTVQYMSTAQPPLHLHCPWPLSSSILQKFPNWFSCFDLVPIQSISNTAGSDCSNVRSCHLFAPQPPCFDLCGSPSPYNGPRGLPGSVSTTFLTSSPVTLSPLTLLHTLACSAPISGSLGWWFPPTITHPFAFSLHSLTSFNSLLKHCSFHIVTCPDSKILAF